MWTVHVCVIVSQSAAAFLVQAAHRFLFAYILIECVPPTEVIVAESIYSRRSIHPGPFHTSFFLSLLRPN